MGPKRNQKQVGRCEEAHINKKIKEVQVQYAECKQQCVTTPSVKRVMKRLFSKRKYNKITKGNSKSILPSKTLEIRDCADVQSGEESSVSEPSSGCNSKFSIASETIFVQTGSSALRKKREASMLESHMDSSVIRRQTRAHKKQGLLSPRIKGSSDATQIGKAVATSKSQLTRVSEPQELKECKTTDKDASEPVPKGNPKTPSASKKRGRKRKADNEDLLLQQMIQCCQMLQRCGSESRTRIAQLLSQEIEKAGGGKLTTKPSEDTHDEKFDSLVKPDEAEELRVNDQRMDSPVEEDVEPQVLEIEATFFVDTSEGGCKEFGGVSLLPARVLYSGVEMGVNNMTEGSNACGGLRDGLIEDSCKSPPPILSPHYPQHEPYSSAPDHTFESLPPDPPCTMPRLEPCTSHSIPSAPNHTQPEPCISVQTRVQTQPHYTVTNCSQLDPHSSVQKHSQGQTQFSAQHHTQLESHALLSLAEPHSSEPEPQHPPCLLPMKRKWKSFRKSVYKLRSKEMNENNINETSETTQFKNTMLKTPSEKEPRVHLWKLKCDPSLRSVAPGPLLDLSYGEENAVEASEKVGDIHEGEGVHNHHQERDTGGGSETRCLESGTEGAEYEGERQLHKQEETGAENCEVDVEEVQEVNVEDHQEVDVEEVPEVDVEDHQEVDAKDDQEVDAEDDQELDAEDDQEVGVEDDPEVDAEDDQEVDAEDDQEVDVEDHQEVDAEDDQEVDVEDDQEVDAEDDQEVDAEDDQEVDAEDDQEVDVEDNQEVDAEDDQEVDAEDDQEVDAEDNQEVDVEDDQEVDVEDHQEVDVEDHQEVDVEDIKAMDVEDDQEVDVEDDQGVDVEDDQEVDVEDDQEVNVEDDQDVDVEDDQEVDVEDDQEVDVEDDQEVDVEDIQAMDVEDDQEVDVEDVPEKDVENNQVMDVEDVQEVDAEDSHGGRDVKDRTADVEPWAQECCEGKSESRQDAAEPAAAPSLQELDTQKDAVSSQDMKKGDLMATREEEPTDSVDGDVLSICASDNSLVGSRDGGGDTHSEGGDSMAPWEDAEDHAPECFTGNTSEGMADDVKDNVVTELPEDNLSSDGLEVGTGSDEATDSDGESLQSMSSIIGRIIENKARCSSQNSLKSDTSGNLSSGGKGGEASGAEGPGEAFREREEGVSASPLPSPSIKNHHEGTDPLCVSDSVVLRSEPPRNHLNPTPTEGKMLERERFTDQERASSKPLCDPFEVHESDEGEELLPLPLPPAAPVQVSTPLPCKSSVPKPRLPQNLGVCFLFINKGFCHRDECTFSHKINLECESYLGLLLLHHITEHHEDMAWSLLNTHLIHCGNSLSLAVSLLLPLARYLVEHSHNRQHSNIKVPGSFALPLDIAKVRILCEGHQGKAAFKLLHSCICQASPEGLQALLNIFVRFCESCPEKELLSPWEKVVLWGYVCPRGAAEATLKDLFNTEWLRIHMLSGHADKVWEVYRHLCRAQASPNTFFTRITCQVVDFCVNTGRLQDSFSVLAEVRRLRANSCPIFTALIPANRKSVQGVAKEVQELGKLVCEMCTPLSASSWSLLLSHIMDIGDLSLALDLITMQMNFMTPEADTVKRLLQECTAKGPAMLPPVCDMVCMLPQEVMKSLEVSLKCLLNACNQDTSAHHFKSLIIKHCRKSGIKLMPLALDAASLVEEGEPCQFDSSFLLRESSSNISDNSDKINTSQDSSSSNSSSNQKAELQHHTLEFSDIDNEEGVCYTSGHEENSIVGAESSHDCRTVSSPAMYGQMVLSLPPGPTPLPPPDRTVSGVNHCLKEAQLQSKPVMWEEVTSQKQPVTIDDCHQTLPSAQSKTPTDVRVRNASHGLGNFLMTPDSVGTPFNMKHMTRREEDSPSNCKVAEQMSCSLSSSGSLTAVPSGCPRAGESMRREAHLESALQDLNSFDATVNPNAHRKLQHWRNNTILHKSEKLPQFHIIHKTENSGLLNTGPNQYLRACTPGPEGSPGFHSYPPCDRMTSLNVEGSHDQGAPLKFPRVANQVLEAFSSVTSPVNSSSQRGARSFRQLQPTTSWLPQQEYRGYIQDQFAGSFGDHFNMQQNHWQPFSPPCPPPSSSAFSAPYVHSSPAAHLSPQMSLRSECVEPDSERNELEHNMMMMHQITAMEDHEGKKLKVAEMAAALTDGSDIFSSGSKFFAIMRTCRSGAPGPAVREVMGAVGILVMVECVQQRILSEAELIILCLTQHRLPFLNNLVVTKECYSEQQLAVMALRVLHHMKNYRLFINILEETPWSGRVDGIVARLELLREVLDRQLESGKSQFTLWHTGMILSSLVTYYHRDTKMLHNYHDFLDLPGYLEAAWRWVEACGSVGIVEQFTVLLSTALHMGLPLPQQLTDNLKNKDVGLGRPLPDMNQRGQASKKWKARDKRGSVMQKRKRKRQMYRGTSRSVQQQGRPDMNQN